MKNSTIKTVQSDITGAGLQRGFRRHLKKLAHRTERRAARKEIEEALSNDPLPQMWLTDVPA